ncbi:MAG: hypothetical protein ACJ75I_03470 [Solirubrobacterales bacterium]
MSETVTSVTAEREGEDQLRRAERGIVAGYIHELSRRHDGDHGGELRPEPATEAHEAA